MTTPTHAGLAEGGGGGDGGGAQAPSPAPGTLGSAGPASREARGDAAAHVIDIALFEPEIAQNTAAILRTAVCLGASVHVIEPAAFDLAARAARRAGLDYAARAALVRHRDWSAFAAAIQRRVVLFTTQAEARLDAFTFRPGDVLLFGCESSGVPRSVHEASEGRRVRIPMAEGARSLNLAVAVGIGLWHARSSIEPPGGREEP